MKSTCLLLLLCSPAFAGKLVLVAGGEKANFKEPFGLDFMPDGSVVLVEFVGNKVTRIDKDGKVTALAGTGQKGLKDGAADQALFNGPHNLAVDKNGVIYVADSLNNVIRKIDPNVKLVSTIAGTGKRGFAGDGGPAKEAEFAQTFHVALDREQKNLYVVDLSNKRVRKIDLATNIVTTVAGNGKAGIPANGSIAAESSLVDPRACALDSKGRLYILERGGHALRVVEDGKIRTVVGVGKAGATGDNGPGTKAALNGPKILWVDKNDDVLIADAENSLIRKYIAKDGTIVRIAGTGKRGAGELGKSPLETEIARPHGVAEGPDGTIWIVDSYNARVLKIVK
jgi:DNA-binding beta-propeller fold protein YncE